MMNNSDASGMLQAVCSTFPLPAMQMQAEQAAQHLVGKAEQGSFFELIETPEAKSAAAEDDAVATLIPTPENISPPEPPQAHGTRFFAPDISSLPETFGQALAAIAPRYNNATKQFAGLKSDAQCAAKCLLTSHNKAEPDDLPCAPVKLRPLLEAFYPARIRMSEKRWANIRSSLANILREVGWMKERQRHQLMPEWDTALEPLQVKAHKGAMTRFAGYCSARNILPQKVNEETIDSFLEYIEEYSLTTNLSGFRSCTRQAWNRLCALGPAGQFTPLEKRAGYNRVGVTRDELPAAFVSDVETYLARCANPGPLDFKFGNGLARETLRKREGNIYIAARYLIDRGWQRDEIDSLSKIMKTDLIILMMEEHFKRHSPDGKAWPPSAAPMASHLFTIAKQLGNVTDKDLSLINDVTKRLRRRRNVFPEKTRERLAAFDDIKVLKSLFALPKIWWKRAQKFLREGQLARAFTWAKRAIALDILLTKPLRISELASIDFAQDLRRDRKHRIIGLCVPGHKTKTGLPIEAELRKDTVDMIQTYLSEHSKIFAQRTETFLFPGKEQGHVAPHSFGATLKTSILNDLGVVVNPHLVRALIATIIFDEDADGDTVAQHMLGHLDITTTRSHYGMQRGRAAQRQYSAIISQVLKRGGK